MITFDTTEGLTPFDPAAWGFIRRDFVRDDVALQDPATVISRTVAHGDDGSPPPATHIARTVGELAFLARPPGAPPEIAHLMISPQPFPGFASIFLEAIGTLPYDGNATITWDQQALVANPGREYIGVWLIPESAYTPLPYPPDVAGELTRDRSEPAVPTDGLLVRSGQFDSSTTWWAEAYSGGQQARIGSGWYHIDRLYADLGVAPSLTRRDQHTIRIVDGRLTFEVMGRMMFGDDLPAAWAGQRMHVIVGVHVYPPLHLDPGKGSNGEGPTAWHLDNIDFVPALEGAPQESPPDEEPAPVAVEPLPAGFHGGVNLPWGHWGSDFGYGILHGRIEEIRAALQPAVDAGLDVVRWWMFPGDGLSRLLDGQWSEIDADIATAEALLYELGMTWQPCLFHNPEALLEASALLSDDNIESLALSFDPELIYSVDIVNEPGWGVWNRGVDRAAAIMAVERFARLFHAAGLRVTVNSAMADEWAWWVGSSLDHLQASWYEANTIDGVADSPYMIDGEWDMWMHDVAYYRQRFGILETTPLAIGECYLNTPRPSGSDLPGFEARGYAHVFGWSANPGATNDRIAIDYSSLGGSQPEPEPEPEPEPVIVGAQVWARDELSDGSYTEPGWRPFSGG